MSTCKNTHSHLSHRPATGHLSHTEAQQGTPHPASSALGSERSKTYRLVFLLRLFWGLPKYSNLREKGVRIGERLVRMSWRVTRVLSGTAEPKSRRSSFGWPGHCSVLKTLSCAHWYYVTHHPWPCPESHLGWACRSCPDTRLHPQTPVSLSCQPQPHLSCPPTMLREASNSAQTVPGQRHAGMAPSCWASCGQAQGTTALSPAISCLPGHHASKCVWGDHTEGRDGVKGAVPTGVVSGRNNTVAFSWLQESDGRRLIPQCRAGPGRGCLIPQSTATPRPPTLGSPAIRTLLRDGDGHLQCLRLPRNA